MERMGLAVGGETARSLSNQPPANPERFIQPFQCRLALSSHKLSDGRYCDQTGPAESVCSTRDCLLAFRQMAKPRCRPQAVE